MYTTSCKILLAQRDNLGKFLEWISEWKLPFIENIERWNLKSLLILTANKECMQREKETIIT